MDWNRIEGNWKQAKGKVKEKWGKLTDDDLAQVNGQRDQLEGRISAALWPRQGYGPQGCGRLAESPTVIATTEQRGKAGRIFISCSSFRYD